MKWINILSLVVLVTMNVFTPISYAQDNPWELEWITENYVETVWEKEDSLPQDSENVELSNVDSEYLETEEELSQDLDVAQENNWKLFETLETRDLEISVEDNWTLSSDWCYRYRIVNQENKQVEMTQYSSTCTGDLDLSKKIDDEYEIVSIGYKAVWNRTLHSIKMWQNVSYIWYLGLWRATEVEFPDWFDYNWLEIWEVPNSYGDYYPWFVILWWENNCFLFDVWEKKIFEYDYERENCDGSEIVIPEKIDGFNVDWIHWFVPSGCWWWTPINSEITNTIVVPNTLISIWREAACIPPVPVCSFEQTDMDSSLKVQASESDFLYPWNQTLVWVKPYPWQTLSDEITNAMLNFACMYRLEQHTVTFLDKNWNQIWDQITVEWAIDDSAFPVIEDEEWYGHSWVDQDGKKYDGEIVTKDLRLRLRYSKIWMMHDSENWIIKISDGTNEIWLRDRNVGASISMWVSKKELLIDLANEYANYNCGLISIESSESIPPRVQEFLQKASEIIWSDETLTCDEILSFIDNFDQVEYRKSFWNYYFWWNNSYITYDEMNFNENGYSTTVTELESNIRLWKIHEDNTWWEEWNTSNPCDATKWEYLPTPKDWEKLMNVWSSLNNVTIDDASNGEWRYQSRGLNLITNETVWNYDDWQIWFRGRENYPTFANDMLLPSAWGIKYYLITNHCTAALGNGCKMTYNYIYDNYSNLWTARNNNGSIGRYNIDMWELYWSSNYYNEDNEVAYPVRCFMIVNPVTVNFDTKGLSDIEMYKLEKWSTITEPATPTREWYTFEWWYTEDGEEWNFDTDTVENDMTLYAKWRVCGEWFTVKNNKCIPDDINMDWIIEISDWNDVIYIRDRNEGVVNDDVVRCAKVNVYFGNAMKDCKWDEECMMVKVIEYVNDLWWTKFTTGQMEQVGEFFQEHCDRLKSNESFWNYYFRWNNNGTNYTWLVVWTENDNNLGYLIENMSDLDVKFLEWWKLRNEEWSGWVKWEKQDNPCDGEWEYLPTPEDWKKLMTIWTNKNWYNLGDEPILVPIIDEPKSLNTLAMDSAWELMVPPIYVSQFLQDMLIPEAGMINYVHNSCAEEEWSNCDKLYYRGSFPGLWASQDENWYVWVFGNGIVSYYWEGSEPLEFNSIAVPVRCFVNMPDVLVVTLMSDGKIVKEVNVVSWDNLSQPVDPTKNWYKFLWWYTSETGGERRNFENNTVNEDIKLYAHREKNQESWSNSSSWWGGWGSSNKIETPKEDNKSDVDNWSTVDNWQKDNEKTEDKKEWNNWDSSNDFEVVKAYNNKYTPELNQAYQFAYKNNITTKNTVEKADMNWKLTRIAMAKMLSQYAINVLWKVPDVSRSVKFKDVSGKRDVAYDNGVTLAYQLWIMWINMKDGKFRPDDEVTRWEFVTALSRLLYWTSDGEYKSTDKYYTNHVEKLKKEWIITKVNPKMKELRWYVMIMLMRSAK